jgi:stage V sporulation protein B
VAESAKPTGAGRGVLYIAFAKLYFMVAGLVVQFQLPAILSRVEWGSYWLVNTFVSPVNGVLVTGTIQTVSRFAAQKPEEARRVQHAVLRMHLRLGLVVAIAFVAAAPLIGFVWEERVGPFAIGGAILAGNAFYATFVGTANGLRQFHKQAALDITFATLRSVGLVGMAMAGLGVFGVVGGWVAAVAAILVLAWAWIGPPGAAAADERLPVAPIARFFGRVAIYLALINLLMVVDTWLLKLYLARHYATHANELADAAARIVPWAAGATGYHANASALADVQVGYYAAVQNFARLSYQAIIAATFVVFPLVSRSTFTDDKDTTRRYIEITTRYSLIFATAIASVMAAKPVEVLGLVYAGDFGEVGGSALVLLAIGTVAFAVFAIVGAILNGAGRTREAIVTAAITLAVAAAGNAIAIPLATGSSHVLEVAAGVTGGAMVVGAVLAGLALRRVHGAFVPLASVLRVAAAAAIAIAVGRVLPLHGKLMTLVAAFAIGIVFVVALIAMRELGRGDLEQIKAVRAKRGADGGDT